MPLPECRGESVKIRFKNKKLGKGWFYAFAYISPELNKKQRSIMIQGIKNSYEESNKNEVFYEKEG